MSLEHHPAMCWGAGETGRCSRGPLPAPRSPATEISPPLAVQPDSEPAPAAPPLAPTASPGHGPPDGGGAAVDLRPPALGLRQARRLPRPGDGRVSGDLLPR